MTASAGCYNAAGCTLGPTANVFLELYGSRVTITDSTAPALSGPIAGIGLLAPGIRSGDEPVTFSATDNVGIRRAELVDVTDAANPAVVAAADYNATATVQNAKCSFTRPRPCPDLKNETLAPSPAIAGKRTLLVRVTDAAGNQTVSTPFAVTARGPVNGAGGGDGSRLVAGFPGHTFRGHGKARKKVGVLRPTKTVGWGHSASVRGILRNAAGQPVAGAGLRLLVRELRLGSGYVDRGAVTTGADGRFAFRIPRGSSRRYRVAYRAYPGDAGWPRSPTSPSTPRRGSRSTCRATSMRGAARASAAPPRPPAAPAGRDARASGPPARPRLAHGQDDPHAQGRRVLHALPLQLRRRPIHVPDPPATERQLSVRARDQQGSAGEGWLDARSSPRSSAPARWRRPRRRREATTSTRARSARRSMATTRGRRATTRTAGPRRSTRPTRRARAPETSSPPVSSPACSTRSDRPRRWHSPPPNTKISDYTVTLRQLYTAAGLNSDPNTPYVMTTFGPYAFTLAGNYDATTVIPYVTQDGHYWGAAGPIDKTITMSKVDSPHSSVVQGTATSMAISAGCWAGRTAVCSLGAGDSVQTQLIGSKVTIDDPVPPVMSGPDPGKGLLAPGTRSGAEPVTFSANDNAGIRRAEIVDVTDAANPSVVASEDYNTGPNSDAGTRCDYTRPRPCPDVKDETIAAPTPIAGHRTLLLRVTDAGGETVVSAPVSVQARGPLNGVNGGDGARLVAGFPAKVFRGKGKKRHAVFVLRSSRTVSYGKGATVRGTLKGSNGQPVARPTSGSWCARRASAPSTSIAAA